MSSFLLDTNVISARRRIQRAHAGVRAFFERIDATAEETYISVVTVGELRRGVDSVRFRGDSVQAGVLDQWLGDLLDEYSERIIEFDLEAAQVWGALRARRPENPIDNQIAATAMVHGLTVVTRNERDFFGAGVPILNPFSQR